MTAWAGQTYLLPPNNATGFRLRPRGDASRLVALPQKGKSTHQQAAAPEQRGSDRSPDRSPCLSPPRHATPFRSITSPARDGLAAPHRAPPPLVVLVAGRHRGDRGGRRLRGGPGPGGARAGAGPGLRPPQRLLPQPRPRPRLLRRHVARAPQLLRRARAAHRRGRRRARRRGRQASRAACPALRCVQAQASPSFRNC